jgi:hypothetical protein
MLRDESERDRQSRLACRAWKKSSAITDARLRNREESLSVPEPGNAEMSGDARPDISQRRPDPKRPDSDAGPETENWHLLAGMIRAPKRGIVPVIRRNDRDIAGPKRRPDLGHSPVERFQCGGIARDVAAVAELAVEID